MEPNKSSVSIFFPCYNDAGNIGKLVEDSFEILKNLAKDFEVIVVDDGSTDHSRQVLEKLAQKYPKLKLVFHDQNKGYGGALRTGFKTASKELVFYTDGDRQYDVHEMPQLLALLTADIDFVNGIKIQRSDALYRVIVGNLYNLVVRWLFWLPVTDVDCDFRIIRKSIIRKIDLQCNSGAICVEIVKKAERAGAKFKEASVHHYERYSGQSQFFKPMRILLTLVELIGLWIDLIITRRHAN